MVVSPDNQQPRALHNHMKSVSFHTPLLKRGIRKSHRLINTGCGERSGRKTGKVGVCTGRWGAVRSNWVLVHTFSSIFGMENLC